MMKLWQILNFLFFSAIFFAIQLKADYTPFFSPIYTLKFDAKKAELGSKLYFEPRFNDDFYSCDSCHNLRLNHTGTSFKNKEIPTLLNAHFIMRFTDKSRKIEDKIFHSIFSQSELNSTSEKLIKTIKANSQYTKEFNKIYGGDISAKNIADAISEFLKTITTPNSEFDRVLKDTHVNLKGDKMRGFGHFMDACVLCHNGVNFGTNSFVMLKDGGIKRTPTLRNITLTRPHIKGKEEILDAHKNVWVSFVEFSDEEWDEIWSFLKTLEGYYER